MKKVIQVSIPLLCFITIGIGYLTYTGEIKKVIDATTTAPNQTDTRLRARTDSAKIYLADKLFNKSIAIFIDMRENSGNYRFFLYNLNTDTILHQALVTHGRCNENWLSGRRYSNVNGSGCTSLGKYKIGNPYYGQFGLAYKLHGLDSSNSNVFERYVVLHSHECVPENAVNREICQSDGCPTVSPNTLKKLQPLLDKAGKPVLLWIYD